MIKRRALYQGFWLICLPLACGYQLAWEVIFTLLFSLNSQAAGLMAFIVAVKLTSELILYALISYYFYKYTYSPNSLWYWLLGALLIAVISLTFYSLISL